MKLTPFWQKIIAFAVAIVAIGAAAILVEDPTARTVIIASAVGLMAAVGIKRPGDRPPVALLPFVLALGVSGCGTLGAISWPAVAACAAPISGALLEALADSFTHASKSQLKGNLKDLAKEHGPEAVVCGAKQIRDDLAGATSEPGVFSATKLDPKKRHVVERIDGFLANTETAFE